MLCLALPLLCTPTKADDIRDYLNKIQYDSLQAQSLKADRDAELQGLGRVLFEMTRPAVELGWTPEIKQDSTLPEPKGIGQSRWVASIEYPLWDGGVRSAQLDADLSKSEAINARYKRRLAELLTEAGESYIRAWKTREIAKAAREAASAAQSIEKREKDRRGKLEAEADSRAIDGEVASLTVTALQADGDHATALAAMSKFGDVPKIVKPAFGAYLDSWEGAPGITEAEAEAQSSMKLAASKDLGWMPEIKAFGSADYIGGNDDADYVTGIKVTIKDPLDSKGRSHDAARIKREATAYSARAKLLEQTTRASHDGASLLAKKWLAVASAARKSAHAERQRLDDARAKLATGKGNGQDVAQSARRLFTAKSQEISATADSALSDLRLRSVSGIF
jgi:outer membrane protein TolC